MTSEKPGPFDRLLHPRHEDGETDRAVVYVVGTIIGLAVLLLVLVLPPVSVLSRGDDDDDGVSGVPATADDYASSIRGGIPKLPEGLVAVSAFFDLAAPEDKRGPSSVQVPLKEQHSDTQGMALYSYADGRWQRVADVTLADGGNHARADVPALPGNVAVLKRDRVALQVAASIPAGATLDTRATSVITTLHPLVFIPAEDGTLAGQPPAVPPASYQVVPTLVALDPAVVDNILRAPDVRTRHALAIADAIEQGNFAGVNVDYHSVSETLRDDYTDFVTQLAEALDARGRTLTLTLPMPVDNAGVMETGAYNWEELGSQADTIELIGELDQELYFQNTEPALEYITERVDRNKVLLSISSQSVERGGDGLRTLSLLEALGIASTVSAQVEGEIAPSAQVPLVALNLAPGEGASGLHWNETARAVTFSYPGRGGKRTVWIANQFSAAYRVELAQRFGLAGVVLTDVSEQAGAGDVWAAVQQAADAGSAALSRPNGELFVPRWQAAGGSLSADNGDTVTWSAPADEGDYEVTLIVSDGVIRAAQRVALAVTAP